VERLTPKEELRREKRHARLTQYLRDHNMRIKDFLVWYHDQTSPSPIETPEEKTEGKTNSADYALHNFRPKHKWKDK